MSEAAGSPDPAATGGAGGPSQRGPWPGEGRVSLSEDDLLAVLDGLGVPGTHEPEEDQEAIAEAEWTARQADDFGAGGEDGEDRALSPALIGEHLPAGPGLAAFLAQDPPAGAPDWDLPGLAAGYRRLAAWAQARELDAAAEIAARRAAANPRIGTGEDGQPASLPPEAAAEIALELRMSQPGASAWTALGCRLRWDLPGTGTALAAGTIDLPRARIIADATAWLTREHAAQVEQRVLPHAGGQTTSQLRGAVRRAVLAIDPEGAEQRRRDTERSAKVSLYPGEEGTATITGACLPGLQAAAAMARITAMARALKSSGAHGGIDLLRANILLGLLLGTLPLIPPPADGPPADAPPDDPPAGGSTGGGAPSDNPSPADGPSDDGGPRQSDDGDLPGGEGGVQAEPQPTNDVPAGPAAGDADPAPDADGTPANGAPVDSSCPRTGGDVSPRGQDGRVDPQDLPGWWPAIPPPADADAPPDDGDPPGPGPAPAGEPDDADDDWPQLPPPDWPPLPAYLPAVPAAGPGVAADGSGPSSASLLARTGLLDVLIPWTTLTGRSREPAVLGRIGPISSWQARELLALATRNPATQWRVILTSDDGRALAVQHARPPRHTRISPAGPAGQGMTGVIGRVTITIRASTLSTPAAQPRPDSPLTIQHIAPAILAAAVRAAESGHRARHDSAGAGGCGHHMASPSYRPPPRIREWVAARDRTCRFGPCGQPAWRTDIDHTIPWHKGGPTCPCNLGGCCRTHHQIKQLPGWHLHQPQPGTFTWTTPASRTYHTQPDPYPV